MNAAPPAAAGPTGPATFPLPTEAAAALEAGRAVRFRDPDSGRVFDLSARPPAGRPRGPSPENAAADGAELTELEALRRAVAEADAEIASGAEPLTLESFWAGMEAEFPELRRDA